ncbi:MAG TPA: hypothetical protein VFN42_06095 [Acetobacteraceae bacterium]|nr:hypothetical protein [Acetobacteraceae bacterium]
MRRTLLLLLPVLLGGCANYLAQRQAFLSQFVGKPDTLLVQKLGVPTRSFTTDGVQYLAYTESRVDIIPGTPGFGWGSPFWGWYGGGFPPQAVTRACETTFAVTKGIVQSYTLRGNACG